MTPPLYNFLQFNIVACTEAEAPQEEDETSNPGLLLVSGRSELDFSSCCCSWKFLKSHVTMLAWALNTFNCQSRIEKNTEFIFFRHFLGEEECSLFILGEAISEVSTVLSPCQLSHRNSFALDREIGRSEF